MGTIDPTDFISANLPLAPVPGIPEIHLHKASRSSGLGRLATRDEHGFGSPYWAYYWAGGLALARYVIDHPEVVAGRRVLDLGAGSGLVAIVAAHPTGASATCAQTNATPPIKHAAQPSQSHTSRGNRSFSINYI